ncbi:DUF1345 domain-containing protein [Subtercola sp. Z020]|nr:DUF1345 domain-containing protein [Subtercola sp. Z020]
MISARRAAVCVAVGAAVGVIVGVAAAPALAPLAGWCTAGGVALIWVWRICWRQDAAGTRRLAQEESTSRVTDSTIVAACLASVAAVVIALVQAGNQRDDPASIALIILGVLGTMVAWALVNTVYALKYARMHYLDHENDAFDVKQRSDPLYSDFAYFAFTIGMSYAGPEIEPTDSDVRRKALFHALLSYFFGTVLIAVAINLVTNLGQG